MNNQNTARNVNDNNAEAIEAAAEELRNVADKVEDTVTRLSQENDKAETGPSNMVSKAKKKGRIKTIKKVVGYSLVVGAVALTGAYVVSRLRAVGVEVGDEVVDAVATATETVVDAVA